MFFESERCSVGDQSALVRQWILLKLLAVRNGGLTVSELASELEVSQKTIRRDLSTFQTVGFPVEETKGEYGRKTYRLDSCWGKPELAFTFDEALALYLGRKSMQSLEGTLVWEAAERAFTKIRASLGKNVLRYLDRVGGAFHETFFGMTDYSKHTEILDSVMVGIEDRKVVWITYQSERATEPVTYDVHPYRLTRHQGSLYLIGLKAREGEVRTWRVDRISAAEVDQVGFTMPKEQDLDAHFAGSFGIYDGHGEIKVRVRISAARARYVKEKQWHPSQQIASHRDGSLSIQFRLSSTVEVKSWILSFGRDAEVLEPESLRRELAGELQTMLERYRQAEARSHTRPKTRPSSVSGLPSPTP
jgi:predicted DNA-binding transcriptional regulator YafY